MVHYKNFKHDASKTGAMYFTSDCGKDWYEAQKEYSADTMKIAYTQTGLIKQADTDVSKIFPCDLSVVEVSVKSLPDNFEQLLKTRGLGYYDGKILPYMPTREELLDVRSKFLGFTDFEVNKYKEQREAGAQPKLSDLQYSQLLEYRQKLRDLPERNYVLPIPPSFLKIPRLYDLEG